MSTAQPVVNSAANETDIHLKSFILESPVNTYAGIIATVVRAGSSDLFVSVVASCLNSVVVSMTYANSNYSSAWSANIFVLRRYPNSFGASRYPDSLSCVAIRRAVSIASLTV